MRGDHNPHASPWKRTLGVYFIHSQCFILVARRRFTKEALPAVDLIDFLEAKGLSIQNKEYAKHCISYIGYYRLKIYMRPFEEARQFNGGATFEQIVEIYNFDRRLRLLCLDAIERIEVALRAHIINIMGAHGGPHFFRDARYFHNSRTREIIENISSQGYHLSIDHYRETYYYPEMPPIWCLTEASTFGQVSRIYAGLKRRYRKEIADGFGLDERICVSWFRALSGLRNICAHHGRVWNARMLVDRPMQARDYQNELCDNTRSYARMVIIQVLLKNIDPNKDHGWVNRLLELIDNRPDTVQLSAMGFPDNWKERQLWA